MMIEICPHDIVEVVTDIQGLCDKCDCFVPLNTMYYRNGKKFHWTLPKGSEERNWNHPANLGWPEVSLGVWKEP